MKGAENGRRQDYLPLITRNPAGIQRARIGGRQLPLDDLAGPIGGDVEGADEGRIELGVRVPAVGESFEYNDFTLTAEDVQGRRVARVRVAKR